MGCCRTTSRKPIEHARRNIGEVNEASAINAAPDAIWAILTDASSYMSWENGVVRVEGRIAPDETIKVVSEANLEQRQGANP